jgi:hypothetical protein
VGFGFWILDFGFWILDFGFWVLGFGFWILDFGFWILDFGLKFNLPRSLVRRAGLNESLVEVSLDS